MHLPVQARCPDRNRCDSARALTGSVRNTFAGSALRLKEPVRQLIGERSIVVVTVTIGGVEASTIVNFGTGVVASEDVLGGLCVVHSDELVW